MNDREIFEQALTALETFRDVAAHTVIVSKALESLRARLAETEDAPVAWIAKDAGDDLLYWDKQEAIDDGFSFVEPLYRHPAKPTGLEQLLERIRFLEQQIADKNRCK